ncbi:proton-conducting transporter transmembrane domain-containing protein [Wenjunlia vitaminophila]|uniref:proton-conducting transporter transmembrane domain-containing protein n=1 Tax=Wenjunlia vitaminophila TaxID=76728 RepID=UPI0003A8DFAE|nr:proton-conducting transporter membrane subunit [Wenjunlia vitaminophila]
MNGPLWALVALPLAVGTALAAAGRRADRCAPAVAVGTATATLGLALVVARTRPRTEAPLLAGLPARLAVDGLSALMVVTVTAVTVAVLLFSVQDLGPGAARARFFGLMLLFAGAMLVTVVAATLPVLLMGWEVMGAASWALVGHRWRDPEPTRAANTVFVTTRLTDLGLYLAAGAALAGGGLAGSLALADLPHLTGPWLTAATAGIVVAALGKSAQLPFSFWLSSAMWGPSPVSALLHSATMVVAGAYLLLRLGPLLSATTWGGPAVAWTGALTALALGLVALAQSDLKQLLAASTCAQIGFMTLAAGVSAATGGTLQLVAHAAAKSLAFLAAGTWMTAWGTQALPALRSAARRHPATGVPFTVAALTLAGLPPLALWSAKDLLLAGALAQNVGLYAVGLAAATLSAGYAAKALWFVWRPAPTPAGQPPPRLAPAPPPRLTHATLGSLLLLTAVCAGLSALSLPPVRAAVDRQLGDVTPGSGGQPGPEPWELALSGGLAVAVLAGAAAAARLPAVTRAVTSAGARPGAGPRHRAARWCRAWLALPDVARALSAGVHRVARALAAFDDQVLARGVNGLARNLPAPTLAALDDRVLARSVNGLARGTSRLATWTAAEAERRVEAAVEGVAAAARAAGRRARAPQTGQLHQYLAQAAAGFTVLAVLFVALAR